MLHRLRKKKRSKHHKGSEVEAIGDIFKGVGSELANAMKGLGEVFQQSEQQSVGDKEKHKAMEKRLERPGLR